MSRLEVVRTGDAPEAIGPYSQAIVADGWTLLIYASVTGGAILRVAAAFEPELLAMSGALWSFAFAIFAARYGPMLFRPRVTT